MRYLIFILVVGLCTTFQNQVLAVVVPAETEINSENNDMAVAPAYDKKETKRNKRINKLKKRLDKINAKRVKKGKKAIDFDLTDPVDKWLWFGLIALGVTIILGVLPILWVLSGLTGLVALICLVIWVLKRFG